MLVALEGIVTLVRPEQPLNAYGPMVVTPLGIAKVPLGAPILPVIAMLDPELMKERSLGIQMAYKVTLLVPMAKVAPLA
jgi:hypothetical protein